MGQVRRFLEHHFLHFNAGEVVRAAAAFYNDAGVGIEDAGLARLAVLDEQGIPAGTVDAATARIGDGRSTYRDGRLSRVNAAGAALGMGTGMWAREAAERVPRPRTR